MKYPIDFLAKSKIVDFYFIVMGIIVVIIIPIVLAILSLMGLLD